MQHGEVFKLDEDYFSPDHTSHSTSSYYSEQLIKLACSKTEHSGNKLLQVLRTSLNKLTRSSPSQNPVEVAKLERIIEIYDCLNQKAIDKLYLSKLVFPGLPADLLKGLRGILWRIFLN